MGCKPRVLALIRARAGEYHARIRQRGDKDADLQALPAGGVKQRHLRACPVHLHRMAWGMGDPGGQPGCINVLSHKLAKPLVAVIPLACARRLCGVAAPQHLQSHLVAPGARLGDSVEIDRDEIPLSMAAPVDEPVRQLMISNPTKLLTRCDVVFHQRTAGFLHSGVRAPQTRTDLADRPTFQHLIHYRPVVSHNQTPLVTPRALKSRGHQNPPPDRYWMLTNALLNTHHGVTRHDRATHGLNAAVVVDQIAPARVLVLKALIGMHHPPGFRVTRRDRLG
ncbi:hypothetical protein CGLAU_00965 [Corynebacterium glaucum]|uniref:Uncharacterized protein n=1 Tax=Corynebacterium glaucum TaxID=187491 RepID=A0A1Q2HTL6_9CORY|nr:hypothetical protein CGLAU_00965 [Corynebacterium glaucum]